MMLSDFGLLQQNQGLSVPQTQANCSSVGLIASKEELHALLMLQDKAKLAKCMKSAIKAAAL